MLIFGSSSLGSQQVLKANSFEFTVMEPDIDEKAIRDPDPLTLTLLLANAKLDALLTRVKEPATVVTRDSVVVHGKEIWEKPTSEDEARAMLTSLHLLPLKLVSGLAVANTENGKRAEGSDTNTFTIDKLPANLIDELVSDPSTYRYAGGFGIQDKRLSSYLHMIEGDFENTVGISISLLNNLLNKVEYKKN